MSAEIPKVILLSVCYLLLFAIAELLYRKAGWKAEYSRKFVHVGSGLLTMPWPYYLDSIYSVLFLCGSFLLILQLSKRYKLLPSINAIDRSSAGSIAYPIAVCICSFIILYKQELIYFYIPLLSMALCDPMAALVGKSFPLRKYKVADETKSIGGSLAFFIPAIAISLLFLKNLGYEGHVWAASFLIAGGGTISEALSRKGWDNLVIPLAVLLLLYLTVEQLQWISLK